MALAAKCAFFAQADGLAGSIGLGTADPRRQLPLHIHNAGALGTNGRLHRSAAQVVEHHFGLALGASTAVQDHLAIPLRLLAGRSRTSYQRFHLLHGRFAGGQ